MNELAAPDLLSCLSMASKRKKGKKEKRNRGVIRGDEKSAVNDRYASGMKN